MGEDLENFDTNEFLLRGDRQRRLEHFALTAIRRESLDAYNRLHSIAEYAGFVDLVCRNYSAFPVIREYGDSIECAADALTAVDLQLTCVAEHGT